MLQSCTTEAEGNEIITQFAEQLFPNRSGALYMLAASRNFLETAATWGKRSLGDGVFAPDQCWGLRRGRVHLVAAGAPGPRCLHVPKRPAAGYLCVPMMAQGETLGLLYVREDPRTPKNES